MNKSDIAAETPWLYLAEASDDLVERGNWGPYCFVCLSALRRYFHIPKKARRYKLVVSERELPESQAFYFCLTPWGDVVVSRKRKTSISRELFGLAENFLKKHFKLTEEPRKLWVQLVYEE